MKRLSVFLVIITTIITPAFTQELSPPNKPYTVLDPSPGYITINELIAGSGLGDRSVPFSRSYFGFTTIHAYQINENFLIGGGTGFAVYNGGTLIPLFSDIRYSFLVKTWTPYLYGEAGLLLNTGEGIKLFLNPGAGIRYTVSNMLAVNFGTGIRMQQISHRNTFVSFRLGVTFKPRLKK